LFRSCLCLTVDPGRGSRGAGTSVYDRSYNTTMTTTETEVLRHQSAHRSDGYSEVAYHRSPTMVSTDDVNINSSPCSTLTMTSSTRRVHGGPEDTSVKTVAGQGAGLGGGVGRGALVGVSVETRHRGDSKAANR